MMVRMENLTLVLFKSAAISKGWDFRKPGRTAEFCFASDTIPYGRNAHTQVPQLPGCARVPRDDRNAGSPDREDRHGLLRPVCPVVRMRQADGHVLPIHGVAASLPGVPAARDVRERRRESGWGEVRVPRARRRTVDVDPEQRSMDAHRLVARPNGGFDGE